MKFILSPSNNPYFNIASEEYLISKDEEYFLIYINAPCIIVGKNQNTLAEINFDYVSQNNIPVVRRMSGGGAVYHDLGNVNFSFVINQNSDLAGNFKEFSIPVIEFLHSLGVDASLKGRNDLVIDDKKFSGNAQFIGKTKMIHHGTLLFNSDLSRLNDILKVDPAKIASKGIKSIKSRVTNILPYLKEKITVEEFTNSLINKMNLERIELSQKDIDEINKLKDEKYSTWEWNFGYSPKYNLKKNNRFDFGNVEVMLEVVDGVIKNSKIYGDFFGKKDIKDIEDNLIGINHEKNAIINAIRNIDEYITGMNEEKMLELLF